METSGGTNLRRAIAIVALVFMGAVCPPSSLGTAGVDYFVENSGDDGLDGLSAATAWETLAQVNSFGDFVAGDSIRFKRGDVWREQLTPPASGTAGNVITFKTYSTGAKPVINASILLDGTWTNHTGSIWKITLAADPKGVWTDVLTLLEKNGDFATLTADQWDWDTGELFVNIGSDPTGGTIEASARICISTNSQDFLAFEELECRRANDHGMRANSPSNDITLTRVDFRDATIISSADNMLLHTVTYEMTVPGFDESGYYLNGGTNIEIIDNVWTRNDGFQMNCGTDVTITSPTMNGFFQPAGPGDTVDDKLVIKAVAACGSSKNVMITNVTMSKGSSCLGIGAQVATGLTVDNVTLLGCVGTDLDTITTIKPGAFGAPGGGTVNNINISNVTATNLDEGAVQGSAVIWIDGNANTGSAITNVTIEDFSWQGEVEEDLGTDAFIKIDMGTDNLDGLTIRNGSFLSTHEGSADQYNTGLQIDGDDIDNVLLENLVFDGAITQVNIKQTEAATYTGSVHLTRMTFDNHTNLFAGDMLGPYRLSYTILEEDVTVEDNAGNTWDNVTMNGSTLTVTENFVLRNSILYNTGGTDLTITAGDTVTGTSNLFEDAAVAGAGTYTDVDTSALFSDDPEFVSGSDFHLTSGSPAIDTGIDVSLTKDLDGITVPQGVLPDMGAFEF